MHPFYPATLIAPNSSIFELLCCNEINLHKKSPLNDDQVTGKWRAGI